MRRQQHVRHHPRLLAMAVLTVAATLAFSGCQPSGKTRSSAVKGVSVKPSPNEGEASNAFRLVNEERRNRGMPALTRRPDLDTVAYAHARDLLRMNKLSHTSSDGRQLENRLDRLDWIWAGENLARNKGFDIPAQEAVRGWIGSPRHNENMFRPDFSQTGMAALYDPTSGYTYFVQVFIIPA